MKRRGYDLYVVGLLAVVLCFSVCQAHVKQSILPGKTSPGKVKNVIIFIGDGMGPQAVGLLNSYAKYAPHSLYQAKGRKTAIESVIEAGTIGFVYHEPAHFLVTDSAASATQIASGKRALPEAIGIDQNGYPTETILEIAQKLGKATGLVSDTRLTDATPAAFAAHQTHRSKESAIAVDLINNKVDVLLSGGLSHWIPQEANDKESEIYQDLKKRTGGNIKIASKRKDSRNLLKEAENRGHTVVFTKDQLEHVESNKLLGLFSYSAIPYRIDFDVDDPQRTIPTLKEMAMKALQILSRDEQGFFLMVEAGLIDQAAHENDAGTLLHEMIRFDETLAYLYDWMKERNDTLLIVTGDHETGGFSFSFSRCNIPRPVDFPGPIFKGEKFIPSYNFGNCDILDKIYQQKISYQRIMDTFDKLPEDQKTSVAMAKVVNTYTGFPITDEEASAIFDTEENEYHIPGHEKLDVEIIHKINDFKEFYYDNVRMRQVILGRVAAKYQNVVWSTGAHTSTPVPLFACGPKMITERFGKLLHTTEWAQVAIHIMSNDKRGFDFQE